ncbi:hypothetical protein ATCC90586_006448 [Pythium insidiosum]|nr:hypothetical protein ATCC90586_006448 [Pythium insidiosum]
MQGPSITDTKMQTTVPTPESFVLRVGHSWYHVLWLLFAVLHAYCAAHLIAMGMLYRYIDQPYMLYFAYLIAPDGDHLFTLSGVAFAIVGGVHLACLVEMLALSLLARNLVLSSDSLPPPVRDKLSRRLSSRLSYSGNASASSPARCQRLRACLHAMQAKLALVFGRHGLLGVEGSLFDVVFVLRETVQIAFLTFQAYQTSARSTNEWLNRLFVALVVAHCWSAPVLQLLLHRRPAVQRVLCIAMDLVFTAGTNMLIPVLILKPYYDAFLPEYYSFDMSLFYNETWFANLVMELRLLFSTTPINFLAKFVTHLSILLCVVSLKSLLAREGYTGSYVEPAKAGHPGGAPAHGHEKPVPAAGSAPRRKSSLDSLKSKLGSFQLKREQVRMNGWKTRVVHGCFVAWGAVIVAVHCAAAYNKQLEFPGCRQRIRPWFTQKVGCVVFEYNCFRLQSAVSPSQALGRIDTNSLFALAMTHCQDLVVPVEIRQFSNLLGVEVYNTSLRAWTRDAALSPELHPSLFYLNLVRTNLTALPPGVLGPLPKSLLDVEFAYTNLTSLPEDLHTRWSNGMPTFFVEFSLLRSFPATLFGLNCFDLSLIGNQLETIPELETLAGPLYSLSLSHNPLRELPTRVRPELSIGFLGLEGTKLARLPDWIDGVVQDRVYLSGATVCGDPAQLAAHPIASCEKKDPRGDGRFPMAIMEPRRQP